MKNRPIAELATGPTLRGMERRGIDAERSEAANAAEAQPLTPWLQSLSQCPVTSNEDDFAARNPAS